MSRKRQSGGQNASQEEAPITNANLERLRNQETQLRAAANQRRQNLTTASQALETASDTFRNATAAEARAQENLTIKTQASQNANTIESTKQSARNSAASVKQQANTEYNSSVQSQANLQTKLNSTKAALNAAAQEELAAKTAANAAQVAKAAANAKVVTLDQEVKNAQAVLNQKKTAQVGLEKAEAVNTDPSVINDLRAWFDASKLTGTTLTSWTTARTINDLKAQAPQMTGTASVVNNATAGLNVVSISAAQTLTLTPTLALPQFTLLAVVRHSGANRNIILRGTDQSKTVYGFTTGRQDYFSIGASQNTNTRNADTNWDIHVFSLNANRVATFFSNGTQIVQYQNITQGFDGLSVNTGGFATSKSDAEIAEIILYDRELTIDERQKLEGLLARKWNLLSTLPQTHPYQTQYPDLLGIFSGGKRKRKQKQRKQKRKTRKLRKANRRRHSRRR